MRKLALAARVALLAGVFFVCASCARFPANGSASGYTRLAFSFTMAQPVDPNAVYVIAIRVLTPAVGSASELSQTQYGPNPVVGPNSLNGFAGGLPTHYILWVPGDANVYEVYRFPLQDPNANQGVPLNLSWPGIYVGPCLPGTAIDPSPQPGVDPPTYGTTLGFAIDTSYLAQSLVGNVGPQSIQTIQFNILTMSVRAANGADLGKRVIDAIGDQTGGSGPTFSDPIQVDITTPRMFQSGVGNLPPELEGDTYCPDGLTDPPIDMVSWQLTVIPPS